MTQWAQSRVWLQLTAAERALLLAAKSRGGEICAALVEGSHRAAHLYWHLSDTKDETYGVK